MVDQLNREEILSFHFQPAGITPIGILSATCQSFLSSNPLTTY
ncbi:hypothetical protein HanPSC8_Chr01g0005451 [Helianthus annuus]|nr:hypothetical protein HanPSC8_Chr01g0005451 [Helianthus annuus]